MPAPSDPPAPGAAADTASSAAGAADAGSPSGLARARQRLRSLFDDDVTTVAEQRQRLTFIVGALALTMAAAWTVAFGALGLWTGLVLSVPLLVGSAGTLALARSHPRVASVILAALFVVLPLADSALGAGLLHSTLWIVAFGIYGAGLTTPPRCVGVLTAGSLASATALLARDLGGSLVPEALWTAYAVFVLGTVVSGTAGRLYARLAERSLQQFRARAAALGDRLSESEAQYQSLIDRLPVGIFRTTPDGRLLDANPAFAEMLGVGTPEAACRLSMASFYAHPSQRQAYVDAMERDGEVSGFLLEWHSLSGETRFSRVDARARTDEGRRVVYEGTTRDITDEHLARRALARVQAHQTTVLRATSDAIVVLDADGRIGFVSPAIEALLGRSPESVQRTPLLDLVHPDERAAAAETLARALATPTAVPPVELALAHADGHAVLVEGVWSAERAADGARVVSFRDVTERRRAEAALRQARLQAEEGVRLKNALLANVSHEVRTPLTAILGFSEILAAELGDSGQREFVDLIAESGERLMATLSSVLDLAQLDAGHVALAPASGRVAPAVVETARLFRATAEAKGLELVVHVESPAAEAALDADAFERVLRHLVGNAVKFTERGRVGVTVRALGGRVLIEIADTGIGISEGFLPHLFEAFEQESSATGHDVGGVGVGLAVSRRLVHQMGGEIAVSSRKGQGTTVTLTFLRTDAAPDARRPDARPVALVLDDNSHARFVAERLLAERYRVRSARTAAALLTAADELALAGTPAALAVLDIHLGSGATGDDVMRALRDRPAYAEAPVLAVTAYALPGDRERFLAAGFDGYLTKPYTRAELLGAIDSAIALRGTHETAPASGTPEPAAPADSAVVSRSEPPRPTAPTPVPSGELAG